MDTSVVITFIIAIAIGWIVYLIYRYKTFDKSIAVEKRVEKWYWKYRNLQDNMESLIKDIHKIFPNSTIQYDKEDDSITGEIKYNVK